MQHVSVWMSDVAIMTHACTRKGRGKGAYSSLWIGNPSQSYRASPAIWDHTVSPATWHRWMRPVLTPAIQAGTRFTYPEGIEGWVDLGVLIGRMMTMTRCRKSLGSTLRRRWSLLVALWLTTTFASTRCLHRRCSRAAASAPTSGTSTDDVIVLLTDNNMQIVTGIEVNSETYFPKLREYCPSADILTKYIRVL